MSASNIDNTITQKNDTLTTQNKKSILFINYPKRKKLEYITCKKYDIEEINFYKDLKKYYNDKYYNDKF